MDGIRVIACTFCPFRSASWVAQCPRCGAVVEQRQIQGTGSIWSHTWVHLPFREHRNGYRLVYVDLDDGPRVLCRTGTEHSETIIGHRVQVLPLSPAEGTGYESNALLEPAEDLTLEVIG